MKVGINGMGRMGCLALRAAIALTYPELKGRCKGPRTTP